MWMASPLPVRRVIGLNTEPRPQGAVKGVLPGINHDAGMSGPYHQVAGPGLRHPAKLVGSSIEIRGTGVGVGKASLLIDGMHQVGAIGPGVSRVPRFERCAQDGQTLI